MRSLLFYLFASFILTSCAQEPTPYFQAPQQIVDLSPTIAPDLPVQLWGHSLLSAINLGDSTEFKDLVYDQGIYYKMAYITLFDHAGPHGDAPVHLIKGGKSIDEISLDRFWGPVILLDFRDKPQDEPLMPEDFANANIKAEDIVIAFMGYDPPEGLEALPSYPYLSGEAAEFLANIPIKAFASDIPSLGSFRKYGDLIAEQADNAHVYPEHLAFLSREIPIIEGLAGLEQIVGEEKVVFVGFPLKVEGGTGGLMRAVALVY